VILVSSIVLFLVNVWWTHRHGEVAGDNPWGASTLEWATSSPPPPYNFLDPPTVAGREALWDAAPDQPTVSGFHDDAREVLITKAIDADPDHVTEFPEPSIWPFLAAVATGIMLIASIFTPWGVVWGSIPAAITVIAWFWPKQREAERHRAREVWDAN
jgi:cytochrome c oxidase subunit I+III